MPSFRTLDGQTLQYGQEGTYLPEDEKAFILSLDKQVRAADLTNKSHASAIQSNLNQISKILKLGLLPEDGVIDEETGQSLQYFVDNRELFLEHGITEHINAKKLEQMTNPAFTETEYAPTIDEMKALEIDIGKLYEDEGTAQV